MKLRTLLLCCLALCSLNSVAHDYTIGSIKIGHPWTRATAPGAKTGGGFLKLENKGSEDRLVSASATVSEAVELHSMSMEGDVMKMRKLDKGIELPAGKTVELKPGGLHMMLVGLKAPLKEGQSFALKLKFEKAGEITVDVKIDKLGASAPADVHTGDHKQ